MPGVFDDDEIFDIVAPAVGRAFFTKVIEALGVETDAPAKAMSTDLRDALTVGRLVTFVEPERLPDAVADAA